MLYSRKFEFTYIFSAHHVARNIVKIPWAFDDQMLFSPIFDIQYSRSCEFSNACTFLWCRAQVLKKLGVKFHSTFLGIKQLRRNFGYFAVNLPWQFVHIFISFKVAVFINVEVVTSSNFWILHEKSYRVLFAAIL